MTHSSFVRFVRLFVYSFILSYVLSFIRLFVYSFIRSFIRSFISFFHSFICSFICSFVDPEESLVVLGPGRLGKLDPLQVIAEILAGPHIAHLPFVPIGSGGRQGVGQQVSVVADRRAGHGYGAVGGECVGIQQHLGLRLQSLHGVEHRLVLQPVVPADEVAASFARSR